MKKKLSAVSALLISLSAATASVFAAQNYSAKDLRALADALHGTEKMSAEQDVNGDGSIDVFDLIAVRKTFTASTGEFTKTTLPISDETVRSVGRNYTNDGVTWLVHSGSAVEFTVNARSAEVELAGDSSISNGEDYRSRYAVLVDDEVVVDETMGEKSKKVEIFKGDTPRTAKVKVIHLSEANNGAIGVKNITVDSNAAVPVAPTADKKYRIEFIGDSITCAYGVEGKNQYENFKTTTENFLKSYAYLTAQKIDADYSAVSYSGHGILSGYTSDGKINTESLVPPYYEYIGKPADYQKPWDFSAKPNDIVVINLGTNDNSYCGTDEEKMTSYRTEYAKFLAQVRKCNPDAHIICTLGTMGATELYPYLEGAVEDFKKESGDTNISCYQSAVQDMQNDGLGSDWHPSLVTQQKSAAVLADKICNVLGIESDQIGLDVAADANYDITKNEASGANASTFFSDYDKSFWVNVVSGGTKSDDICMKISGIDMKKGGKYRISFKMTGDKGREIPISIKSSDGAEIYSATVAIEGEKTPFAEEFTSSITDKASFLTVEMGGKDYSNVTLYELHIEKIG
ncbi:MAG: carbohydrate binding domain-containing protein [Ruminococcus sp.]|nr:carbohydrate binding domain-containing protein [Ruminococcus sp.]